MSKIQSSIQKALEKTRAAAGEPSRPKEKSSRHSRRQNDGTPSGVFRIFRFATPNPEIMEDNRIVSAVDDRAAKTAYDMLRTRVLQRLRSNSWRSLLITSPGPGEGKTLTSSNLAISISRDVNQSVLLVDLDLRRSSIAKYLGIEVDIKVGVGDFLQGNAEINDIVYTPGDMTRIALLPNREPIENASDLLGSPRMKQLVSWLRDQSNQSIVIFDMPPVLGCDDVLAFSPEVDAVLLVATEGITDRAGLEKTAELLADCNLMGIVLNRATETMGHDYYGY